MTVLIITTDFDRTADEVVLALVETVPVLRLDISWFPQQVTLEAEFTSRHWEGWLSTQHHQVNLNDIRSVWYRWRSAPAISPAVSAIDRDHARREARTGFNGVIQSLNARHVNHPGKVDALTKPQELVLAARCGLTVPKTVITNSPRQIHDFATSGSSPVVRKLFSCSVPDGDGDGRAMVGHTRLVTPVDLNDLDTAVLTAHQVQSYVDKIKDIRVVIVGETFFPIGITSLDKVARVDFRANYRALSYKLIELPAEVIMGIRAFMSAAGLVMASMDFSLGTDGRYYFLECNPAGGQFQWLQQTGAPIAQTLATLLASPWEGK